MKRKGRPPKIISIVEKEIDRKIPLISVQTPNQPLLPVALTMANQLLEAYKEKKQTIQNKYRECEFFKEGIEYKSELSRIIGSIESLELFIKKIKELLK